MTTEQSRLRQWCWLVAPIWTARFDQWCARRAKARRAYERQLTALAAPPTPPVEPEPRDLDSIWLRSNPRIAAQPWRAYAEELKASQRALHRRIGTNARDNLMRRFK
jgi:hypothetical protein